jgi:hypothetical protein
VVAIDDTGRTPSRKVTVDVWITPEAR